MDRKGSALLITIGIVVLLIATVGYFAWKSLRGSQTVPQIQQTTSSTTSQSQGGSVAGNTTTSTPANLLKGETAGDPLALFLQDYPDSNGISYELDDGIINSGPYTGYHRIIAAQGGNVGYSYYTFATNDYKTFIYDSNSDKNATKDLVMFDRSKVIGVGAIPSNFPASIDEGNFVLLNEEYRYSDPVASGSTILPVSVPGISFTAEPFQQLDTSTANAKEYNSGDPSGYQQYALAHNEYFLSDTYVTAQDQSGLIYDYSLVPKEAVSRFEGPNYNFEFYLNSDFGGSSTYNAYGQLLPGGCGGVDTTYVLQNISSTDLVQVGVTAGGVVLYTLKDIDHPLNQAMYYDKITANDETPLYPGADGGETSDQIFEQLNNGAPPPTYQQYVAKDPVLIFKDSWGRWVGLGEFDYQMPGGCGKPVIYLYPPKPTDVAVKFAKPPYLTTDIPTYANGWNVMAYPDGKLIDLQPQFTDCSMIDSTIPGSEYAQSACERNDYPYLYWEGQATGRYPTPQGGWIVPQKNISSFLDDKLTEIGLTDKEKNDMMNYWVPQLLEKNAAYYRISFFQTAQMNQFIPMQVSPQPDTVIRVFLDWSPLATMPAIQLQPEVLDHINRTGFTLVEWGGLKQ